MRPEPSATPRSLPLFVWGTAAAHLILHVATNGRYGIFRDEFYYLACADRLDWGYVDHPPLSIALLAFERLLLGDSVHALRVLPALCGAGLVLLAAVLARALGGGRFAQGLAALCVAIVPQYLVLTGYYSMNAYDLVFWAVAALVVVRLVTTDDDRLWLALGATLGLALLNKISPLFFGAGLLAGIVLTPLRSHLRRRNLWWGGLIAAALFLPHVVWQVRHGWPTLEFIRNATRYKIADFSVAQFASAQLSEIHPFNAPIWLFGVAFLFFGRGGRFRALALVYIVAFAIMAAQKSKPYYLGPAYPMLLAAGAVWLESWTSSGWRARARLFIVVTLLLGGGLVAPVVVPILPVERLVAYLHRIGETPGASEKHTLGPLPQHFADRFGWEEMARAVASVHTSLPSEDRARAMIVTSNYGQAGALRYFGRRLGLPDAVSQHNNFYLWGPGTGDGSVVITVGMPAEELRPLFESVTIGPRLESPYAMPYETREPILLCRGLKLPLVEVWPRGKSFI